MLWPFRPPCSTSAGSLQQAGGGAAGREHRAQLSGRPRLLLIPQEPRGSTLPPPRLSRDRLSPRWRLSGSPAPGARRAGGARDALGRLRRRLCREAPPRVPWVSAARRGRHSMLGMKTWSSLLLNLSKCGARRPRRGRGGGPGMELSGARCPPRLALRPRITSRSCTWSPGAPRCRLLILSTQKRDQSIYFLK